MLKIYHNPRCSKSRAGLKYLVDNGIDHEIIEYLTLELSPTDIKYLADRTGLQPFDLVRTHEDVYKKNYKGKEISNEEWYKILSENPKLLHRPIVIKDTKGVFAQPPEKINDLL
ncbi:MAG: hypothetical protein PF517_22115 [Salinivirgaceae bacterium]|jgi:arsenate reductase (glutaredoxin)|nr:hypothetical protein [Salinivirgaceae bacterium]